MTMEDETGYYEYDLPDEVDPRSTVERWAGRVRTGAAYAGLVAGIVVVVGGGIKACESTEAPGSSPPPPEADGDQTLFTDKQGDQALVAAALGLIAELPIGTTYLVASKIERNAARRRHEEDGQSGLMDLY